MDKRWYLGHLSALLTILIWGTTFVSTKLLLNDFSPVEILFYRFALGFLALILAYPKRMKWAGIKRESYFAFAGLCGISLYYLLENVALTYTMTSNVGIIVSVAPFFTAMLTHLFMKGEEPLKPGFFVGFLIAMSGIVLLSVNKSQLTINPLGDFLAVAAAFVWACYGVLTRKIGSFGYHIIPMTRRIFFYGLVFMLPVLGRFDCKLDLDRFLRPINGFNMLFLGLGASALCFATWNYAVRVLGAVKTSTYIYLVPVITVVTSVMILHEKIGVFTVLGTILTISGLFVSTKTSLGKK